MGYVCATCGEYHDELPMGFGWRVPDGLASFSDDRLRRCWLVVDELATAKDDTRTRHFFIKGNLEIPVHDADRPFILTVWVTLDEEVAIRALDHWFDETRVEDPPGAGYLQNEVFTYPGSLNLPATVRWEPVGIRPLIEIQHAEHALGRDQRDGVPLARVEEFAAVALHL